MATAQPGRNWRRFLLGLSVLLGVGIMIALAYKPSSGANPVISFFAGSILGYFVGWWVTAKELV